MEDSKLKPSYPLQTRELNRKSAFTLVETMVVVVIISILARVLIAEVKKIQLNSRSSAVANDFRVLSGAIQAYAQQNGSWPAASTAGSPPAGMTDQLRSTPWTTPTPIGGYFVWQTNATEGGGKYTGVLLIQTANGSTVSNDTTQLTDIDKKTDNGNLTTGNVFLGSGNALVYVVAP
jgi:prepilin-type N-terminal cleavage/methylation domain-containing protein